VQFKALSGREVIGDAGSAVLALAEANFQGATEPQPEKVGSRPSSRTIVTRPYKVEAGDTGYGIAQKLKVRYEMLCECNPGKDLGDIQIGEIIRIPQR
jgi:LysM repeat protein